MGNEHLAGKHTPSQHSTPPFSNHLDSRTSEHTYTQTLLLSPCFERGEKRAFGGLCRLFRGWGFGPLIGLGRIRAEHRVRLGLGNHSTRKTHKVRSGRRDDSRGTSSALILPCVPTRADACMRCADLLYLTSLGHGSRVTTCGARPLLFPPSLRTSAVARRDLLFRAFPRERCLLGYSLAFST